MACLVLVALMAASRLDPAGGPRASAPRVDPAPRPVVAPPPISTLRSAAPFADAVERWRPQAAAAAARITDQTATPLDPDLLLALVSAESAGDPMAHSAADALGLLQVRVPTFREQVAAAPALFPQRDPLDPDENLRAGGLYLVWCAHALGVQLATDQGLRLVLHAYNAGPARIEHLLVTGSLTPATLPRETRQQADRVLAAYAHARLSRATS